MQHRFSPCKMCQNKLKTIFTHLRPEFGLTLALAAGALLRAIHLYFWAKTPYYDGYFLDELYHYTWAKHIIAGNWFPNAVFFRAPGYAYFLATIFSVFGSENHLTPRILQFIIGLSSIIAVYKLSFLCSNNKKTAAISSMIWAIVPTQIFFEARLLLDSVFTAGIPWLFLCNMYALKSKKLHYSIFTGIVLGILALFRPTILIIFPVLIFFLFRNSYRKALITLLSTGIIIAPITIANLSNGDNVLIASQGGINFYIGNNPQSDGASASVPEFGNIWSYNQCAALAEEEIGTKLLPSDLSRFFFNKGIAFWSNNLRKALTLTARKTILLLGGTEIGNNGNIYYLSLRSPVIFWLLFLGFGWSILLGLIISGIINPKNTISRSENYMILLIYLIVYSASIIAFFMCTRFRLPILPIISVFAGMSVATFLEAKSLNRIWQATIFCAVYTLSMLISPYKIRFDDALSHYINGNIALRSSNMQLALSEFTKSTAFNENIYNANLNIGIIYLRERKYFLAKRFFEREIDANGDICKALNNLSVIERLQRNYMAAESLSVLAQNRCSHNADIDYNYLISLYESGKFDIAHVKMKDIDSIYNDNWRMLHIFGNISLAVNDSCAAEYYYVRSIACSKRDNLVQYYDITDEYTSLLGSDSAEKMAAKSYYNLAQIYFARKNLSLAENCLRSAVELDATFAPAFANLGSLELSRGNLAAAENALIRSESLGFASKELFFNIAALHARLAIADRQNAHAHLIIAKSYLEKALHIDEDFDNAKKALIGIEKALATN